MSRPSKPFSNWLLRHNSKRQKRSPSRLYVLILLILGWSLCLGWSLAFAKTPPLEPSPAILETTQFPKSVDPPLPRYQLGAELYLENCATCHIAIPPAVLPTETWLELIQDSEHYGVQIQPLVDPTRLLVWNYLRTYSRQRNADEQTPYRIASSRFFKALHPDVKFSQPVNLNTCANCHIGTEQYDFRALTPEWQN